VLVLYRGPLPRSRKKSPEWCRKKTTSGLFSTPDDAPGSSFRPENLNIYKAVHKRGLPLYETLLRSADAVTTTTEALASHLRQWNPKCHCDSEIASIPDEWTCPAAKQ